MVGINPQSWNSLSAAETFVSRYGLTFTNLWDSSNAAWEHYGGPYTSRALLVQKQGNRVEQTPREFSTSRFQRLVDGLD